MSPRSGVPVRRADLSVPAEATWLVSSRVLEEANAGARARSLPEWTWQTSPDPDRPGNSIFHLSSPAPVIRGLALIGTHVRGDGLVPLTGLDSDELPPLPATVSCSGCGTKRAKRHHVLVDPATGAVAALLADRCADTWLAAHAHGDGAEHLDDWATADPIAQLERLVYRVEAQRRHQVVAVLAAALWLTETEGFISRSRANRTGRWATADQIRSMAQRETTSDGAVVWPPEVQDRMLAAAVLRMSVQDDLPPTSDYHQQILNFLANDTVSDYAYGVLASVPDVYSRWQREQAAERAAETGAGAVETYADEHVGQVGERLTFPDALVESVRLLDTGSTLVILRDRHDHRLTWFASRPSAAPTPGARVTITGTVRAHKEFRGVKDTTINRCSFT